MRIIVFGVLVGGKLVGWRDMRIGCCFEGGAAFGASATAEDYKEGSEDREENKGSYGGTSDDACF
tara:strand:+ start:75 stop:269 length:195 start_codon:yes stop_codon:yes gene_type:complete